MSDPILIFGVILLGIVMMWFFGVFDDSASTRYDITLPGDSLALRDDWVDLEFRFENPVDLDDLRHIPLSLTNHTSTPLAIQSCLMVDPSGKQRKMIVDLFSDVRESPGPGDGGLLSPGKAMDVLFIPQDNIKPGGRLYTKIAGAKPYKRRDLLFSDWLESDSFGFGVSLRVASGDEPRNYELEFRAVRHLDSA